MARTEALSLLDIAPRSEMVEINDEQSLRVRGLSADAIRELLMRFPPLQGVIMGAGIDASLIVAMGPDIVGSLCAAASGELNNEEAEKMAAMLPVETQLDIIEAIGRCTFSKGFGPFADRVAVIAAALSVQAGKAPDTNLQNPSPPLEEPQTPPSGS